LNFTIPSGTLALKSAKFIQFIYHLAVCFVHVKSQIWNAELSNQFLFVGSTRFFHRGWAQRPVKNEHSNQALTSKDNKGVSEPCSHRYNRVRAGQKNGTMGIRVIVVHANHPILTGRYMPRQGVGWIFIGHFAIVIEQIGFEGFLTHLKMWNGVIGGP
jgi:hypothetical protein